MKNFPLALSGDESVIDAFYQKNRRLGIVTCAGGNRNAMAGGAFISLRSRSLRDSITSMIGVSGGIASNAYFLGGAPSQYVKVYTNDTSDKRMFNLWRKLRGQPAFDVDYLESVFRMGTTGRAIFAENVATHASTFHAVLGHAETGEAIIETATCAEDVWQLATYGAAVTGFARETLYKGVPVTDGYFTDQNMPVKWLAEHESLTDIIVFASTHQIRRPAVSGLLERFFYRNLMPTSAPVEELLFTRHVRFMEAAEEAVAMKNVRVLIIWVPTKLSPVNLGEAKSRELIQVGYQTMERLFHKGGYNSRRQKQS